MTETNRVDTEKKIEAEIKASLDDGYLPCARAFQIAKTVEVSRSQVGDTANTLKVRIADCQLGCFVVEKAIHNDLDSVQTTQPLAEAVTASLIDNHLPCAVNFELAKKHKVAPRKVADTANKLKIKISQCQLGCFP